MKKILYTVMLFAGVALLSSCDNEFLGDKDAVGGTETEATAGEWYVWADGIDANGEVIDGYEDFYGGRFMVYTFNTAENKSSKMFIQDSDLSAFLIGGKAYYGFQVECTVNGLTFSTEVSEDVWYGNAITIKNGIIIENGGHQNNGSVADSISFEVYYPDGNEYYTSAYGHAGYRIYGVRYSGLEEND